MGIGEGRAIRLGSRLSALRPESVQSEFRPSFPCPGRTGDEQDQAWSLFRRAVQVNSARGGGDIRWLAQNYTGRKIHTATKQDQLKIGFRTRVRPCSWSPVVSPKGFPRCRWTGLSGWVDTKAGRFAATMPVARWAVWRWQPV